MPNIRVDVDYAIKDGTEIKFRSPVDCSQITGLVVYYPGLEGNTLSKVFAFSDAHGNNVGDIDHLFAEDVVVKVILDVTKGMAFVQNADTNAYLEAQLASKAPGGYGLGTNGAWCDDANTAKSNGWYKVNASTANMPGKMAGAIHVCSYSNVYLVQTFYQAIDGNSVCRRVCDNDVFGEWEWDNPPMKLNTEYRTTERWNEKAVYTKLVDCGLMPNTSTKDVSLGFTPTHIISCEISGKKGVSCYSNFTSVTSYAVSYGGEALVRITTSSDLTEYNGYCLVRYTKD